MLKTARFLVILLFLPLLFLAKPAFAQQYNFDANPDVPKNVNTWTQTVMLNVIAAASCQLSGLNPLDKSAKCLGWDQKSGKIGFLENGGGLIGVTSGMIGMLYTPPASSIDYFKYLGGNFGVAKKTYAAGNDCKLGIGFCGIEPIIGIWAVSRNLVYLLFVVIFVVIGFAIMFRVKIDPRTVMTLENTIPRIIMGLLLVTFSFAIAGFLIDFMYIFIYFFFNVALTIPVHGLQQQIAALNPLFLQGQSPAGALGGVFGIADMTTGLASPIADSIKTILSIHPYNPAKDALPNIFQIISDPLGFMSGVSNVLNGSFTDPSKNGPIDYLFNIISLFAGISGGIGFGKSFLDFDIFGNHASAVGSILGLTTVGPFIFNFTEQFLRDWLPYILVYIVLLIAILYSLLRLWFQLILSYVNVLIDIVFAPWWIMLSILPESKIGFSVWVRDLLANLAAFPAALIMLTFAFVFKTAFTASGNVGFNPPLLGLPGQQAATLGSLVAMGFILTTPNVVTIVKNLFKAPPLDLGPITPPIAAGISPIVNTPRRMLEIARRSQEYEITTSGTRKIGLLKAATGFEFRAEPRVTTGKDLPTEATGKAPPKA